MCSPHFTKVCHIKYHSNELYNEHIHRKTHHLNLDAVESLKLTEKLKGRKSFPFFAGCISSLPYFFLPFVWGEGEGEGEGLLLCGEILL